MNRNCCIAIRKNINQHLRLKYALVIVAMVYGGVRTNYKSYNNRIAVAYCDHLGDIHIKSSSRIIVYCVWMMRQ
jgi:hypothetical protein